MKVSVVIPSFNERNTIAAVVRNVRNCGIADLETAERFLDDVQRHGACRIAGATRRDTLLACRRGTGRGSVGATLSGIIGLLRDLRSR